jgi:methyl-accepting chemotaxis protein
MRRWIENLRVAHKLFVGFGFSLALTSILTFVAAAGLASVRTDVNGLSEHSVPALDALGKFALAAGQARIKQFKVAGYEGDRAAGAAAEVDQSSQEADKALANYESTLTSQEGRKNFEELSQSWTAYKTAWLGIRDKVLSSTGADRFTLVDSTTTPLYLGQVHPHYLAVSDWAEKQAASITASTNSNCNNAIRTTIFLGVASILIGGLFGRFISQVIVAPLSAVAGRLERLRDHCVKDLGNALAALERGDLTVQVVPSTTPLNNQSQDEIGRMSRVFDGMLSSLQSTIGSYSSARVSLCALVGRIAESSQYVAETSQSLAAAAEQSVCASRQIAEGSERLARGASEAAGTMENVSDQVSSVKSSSILQESSVAEARKALEAAEQGIANVAASSEQMAASAHEGNEAVKQTAQSMLAVKQRVEQTAEKIQELDAKGQQIGHIVNTIQAIAEQTNLLALNAAIEAARAGEHGRGFAVVADEVRKLAEGAQNATREITELIGGVRTTVRETVDAIHLAREDVLESAKQSEEAGRTLGQILDAAQHVAIQTEGVAKTTHEATTVMKAVADSAGENLSSAQEMAAGTDRVADAISNVAAVSEQSAAGAQELTASINEAEVAAQRLNEMSVELRNLVAQFTVDSPGKKQDLKLAA